MPAHESTRAYVPRASEIIEPLSPARREVALHERKAGLKAATLCGDIGVYSDPLGRGQNLLLSRPIWYGGLCGTPFMEFST